jgi:hypothetical protein
MLTRTFYTRADMLRAVARSASERFGHKNHSPTASLARDQAQSGQKQLAMFDAPEVTDIRHHYGRDRTQPR